MSKFQATVPKASRKPDRIVVLAPTLFAHDWPNRPSEEVALGLRSISERDVQIAKGDASKAMLELYGDSETGLRDSPKAYEFWNDAFLARAVARAACDPNDIDVPYFKWAEDETSKALTSEGLRYLWDEYLLIHRGRGERAQASDQELGVLAATLAAGGVGRLEPDVATEVRKHLAWCHEMMAKAGALIGGSFDDDGAVYVAAAAHQ